ncbi:unnamed protein product [Mycena citricolor]|uniref:NAD(P)-binding protein n=1 Tax=Mycena citricolor TaxID=2018698 RepID=A0AAD2HB62_9AGAR|nr:unnamed protein product [Mycena citricolor]
MVNEFLPLLMASGDGRIVNIGSIAGVMPYPFGSAYNASKAALHAYGNTLRIELAPFNVQVSTIVTGGVQSHISDKPPPTKPTSLYAPIAEHLLRFRAGRSQKGAMPADVYARSIVSQTLRSHLKAWIWKGSFTGLCWFIDTFLWRTAFDVPFSREFGLVKLGKIFRSGVGKKQS